MDKDKLTKILQKHRAWLNGENGGERADLSRANLSDANFSGAYFSGADLSRADLSGANFSGADLSGANFSGANFSGADFKETLFDGINWLAYLGIVPDHQGIARAYKVITRGGEGIYQGGINYLKGEIFIVDEVDQDATHQCAKGIHLATFPWCLNNKKDGTNKLLMFSFNVKDCVCPIGTDGKFRVKKCHKLGECDWHGNLL